MKKDVFLRFLFLAVIAGSLMAEPEPSWWTNRYTDYPDSRYIIATGIGFTLKDAEADAMKGIASYFKSTVSAQDKLISQYTQVVSSKNNSIRKDDKKESILDSMVVVSTHAEMRGVRFAHWQHESRWSVLGYIDKQESIQMYENRINTHKMMIDSLIGIAHDEPELMYKYDYYRTAVLLAKLIEEDNRSLLAIPAPSMNDMVQYTRNIIAHANNIRSQLVFDVQINADRRGRIRQTLSRILADQGYVTNLNRATYTIQGTISTYEEELGAGIFVTADIKLDIVNNEGRPIFSYAEKYDRTGHRNENIAYGLAFRKIEQDLEANFISKFNAFIGD